MLAEAEQLARGAEEPRRAELVIGLHGGADVGEAVRTGHRIGRQLGTAYPDRSAVVLLLSQAAPDPAALAAPDPREPPARVPLLPWSRPGQTSLEALLRATETFDAAACALVTADAGHGGTDRKSTRLNSSHVEISYAVFCL